MKNSVWVVQEVEAKDDYTLLITFTGGMKRIYNARPLLEKEVYSSLTNINYFLRAKAEYGTVIWDDDVDIAPEYLYENSQPFEN